MPTSARNHRPIRLVATPRALAEGVRWQVREQHPVSAGIEFTYPRKPAERIAGFRGMVL
jgi:hypothetical protein